MTQEINTVVGAINTVLVSIVFMVFFYKSMKICFLKEKKGGIKLILLSVVTSPLVLYLLSLLIVGFLSSIAVLCFYGNDSYDNYLNMLSIGGVGQSVFGFFIWVLCIFLVVLISQLVGKRYGVYNRSLVTFVYQMFLILYFCTGRSLYWIPDDPRIKTVAGILFTAVDIVSVVLLYHFDIKALSKMTDKKRTVNWKIFVFVPSLISAFFMFITVYQYRDKDKEAALAMDTFSLVLCYLFIWAFYIIIQNINSTNEALEAKDEVKELSVEVMEALAHTIDAKDEYTRGHSVRVAKYSRLLAEKMGLSPEERESVYYMGLLHDIGKIGVPNEIINSKTKLTDEQYAVIKTHPGVGFGILDEIKSRPDLSIGARWHHERYDGKGYPDGMKGEDIPLFARIIAVADSYDAMTSNRSYRAYMSQEKVRAEIEKNIGTQFDPDVAKKMLIIMDEDTEYTLHEGGSV